jgi:hypothetical protein
LVWPCHKFSQLTGHRTGTKFPRHSRIFAAKEMLPEQFFSSLFKFAFVRNPWDLQVSSFHHLRRERPRLLGGVTDFGEFLKHKLDPERPYQYHIDTSLQLQLDYLVDLHGDILVDFIGRYERLEADFREACNRIGVTARQLPHRRKAADRQPDYRAYYTDETAQLVAERFAPDIKALGYRFDP